MLVKGKIVDEQSKSRSLTKESDEAKKFYQIEEVARLIEDEELFHYFFYQMDNLGDWTDYYDEPTRKVKYKYEDG